MKPIAQCFAHLALLALVASTSADIINVPTDQPTIQVAIAIAVDGDEIIVAPGTYNEIVNFLNRAVTVRSSGGPAVTIIDGAGLNDTVVKCLTGEEPDTLLEGFTITGGSGSPNPPFGTAGGGMRIENSSPTIKGCIFTGNTTSGANGRGGGIYLNFSNSQVIDCLFSENAAPESGSGIWMAESNPNITGCRFENHEAAGSAAIQTLGISMPTISNCTFINNVAMPGSGGAIGLNQDVSATINNSVFVGNSSDFEGGAINLTDGGHATIVNCTFVGNSGAGGGALHNRCCGTSSTVVNSIFWDNGPVQIFGNTTATNSDIQGSFPGTGNIDEDPLFLDPDNGDFHIAFDSPCIDVGDNSVVEPDAVDMDGEERIQNGIVDMGADEFNFCIADINGDGVVGPIDLAMLLAAWGPCPEPPADCPADIHGDGDGIVQADDLATLLANWGPCE